MAVLVKESFNDIDFCLDPSLALYVPLYHIDGASFMSRDHYGHLCTVTGATWTPRGRRFDGTDDYLILGSTAFSRSLSSPITIECWLNPDGLQAKGLENIQTDWATYWWGFRFFVNANGTFSFLWSDGTYPFLNVASTGLYISNTWSHLATTYNNQVVNLFLNGNLDKISAQTRPLSSISAGNLLFSQPWLLYKGLIGEVRIYNRALTPLEIQNNYLVTKWRYQ